MERDRAMGLTRMMARVVARTRERSIPRDTYEHAKVVLLDWLGCTLAGARHPVVSKLLRYADREGGYRQATVLGHTQKRTVTQAALINGAASHVMDYDDTSTVYIGHASAGMIAALLALAEWKDMRGADFLAAHSIASKIADFMGVCAGMEQYRAGWHTTSTIGHIAAAAGCARLLRLSEGQTVYALGLAGTTSAGLKVVFGSMAKSFHAGNACRAGLMAALLAGDNFTCAEDFFEGTNGYLQLHGGKAGEEELKTLGTSWGFENLAQKYHASCHFTHSAIEAVLSVAEREKLAAGDIRSIEVHVSPLALKAAGKTEPRNALEGKFSLPYCVANALLNGDTGLGAFTGRKVRDPLTLGLMRRISLFPDDTLPPMAARVVVESTGGDEFSLSADVFREIPGLADKRSRIQDKFLQIGVPLLGEMRTRKIMERVLSLEETERMGQLVRMIRFYT